MEHYGHDSRTRLRGNSRAYNDGLGDQLTRLGKTGRLIFCCQVSEWYYDSPTFNSLASTLQHCQGRIFIRSVKFLLFDPSPTPVILVSSPLVCFQSAQEIVALLATCQSMHIQVPTPGVEADGREHIPLDRGFKNRLGFSNPTPQNQKKGVDLPICLKPHTHTLLRKVFYNLNRWFSRFNDSINGTKFWFLELQLMNVRCSLLMASNLHRRAQKGTIGQGSQIPQQPIYREAACTIEVWSFSCFKYIFSMYAEARACANIQIRCMHSVPFVLTSCLFLFLYYCFFFFCTMLIILHAVSLHKHQETFNQHISSTP